MLGSSPYGSTGSSLVASLARLLSPPRPRSQTHAWFGSGFGHRDHLRAVQVCRFWLGGLGRPGGLGAERGGVQQALSARAGPEDVDVLHAAAPDLRGVGAGGPHLQVDPLDPPGRTGESNILMNGFTVLGEAMLGGHTGGWMYCI